MKKLLILPDIHVRKARNGEPAGQDMHSINAVLAYAETRAPYDQIIQLGDFWDFPYFSRFEEARIDEALKYYEQDLAAGEHLIMRLGELTKKLIILEGNHDFRAQNYLKRYPHLEGRIELPGEIVKSWDATWVPYWSDRRNVHTVGKANFIHGRYTNQNHTKSHATHDFMGENVFYGHVHDEMSYSPKTRWRGFPPVAQSCGCLCRFDQPWLRGAATNWQHMFVEMFVQPGGKFTYYNYRLFNHRFIGPDGKEYKG